MGIFAFFCTPWDGVYTEQGQISPARNGRNTSCCHDFALVLWRNSAFGIVTTGLFPWILGVTIALGLGIKIAAPGNVTFFADTQTFVVPGSWLPLFLMMAIFFMKYAGGVILTRQLPIANETVFIGFVSLCYGLMSGVFLARATVVLNSKTQLRV